MTELLDVSTEPVIPAQTPAPGSEPSSWMPLSDEQRNTAPENIKKIFETKKWSSVDDLANNYEKLEQVLGKGEHIFKPESPDDADGWNKYYQQLGVPDDINGYEFEADEAVPFADEVLSRFKEFAKNQHYTKEQAAGAVAFQREIIKEAVAAETEAEAQAATQAEADLEIVRKALVTKAGGEVAYQGMMVEARQVADALGIYPTLEKMGLASNPEVISMLTMIKENTTEGVLAPGTPTVPTKDPQEELNEIMKSEAFTNRFAPGRKAIMARYMELNKIIANSGKAPVRPQGG